MGYLYIVLEPINHLHSFLRSTLPVLEMHFNEHELGVYIVNITLNTFDYII